MILLVLQPFGFTAMLGQAGSNSGAQQIFLFNSTNFYRKFPQRRLIPIGTCNRAMRAKTRGLAVPVGSFSRAKLRCFSLHRRETQ
jgi:hypothetical protein